MRLQQVTTSRKFELKTEYSQMSMKGSTNSRNKWRKTVVSTTQQPKMKKRMKTTTPTKMVLSGGRTTTAIGGIESQDKTIGKLTTEGPNNFKFDLFLFMTSNSKRFFFLVKQWNEWM